MIILRKRTKVEKEDFKQSLGRMLHKETKVKAEFIDNKKEFKWRLVKGKEKSRWFSHYENILIHTFKDKTKWGLVTQYWSSDYPTENLPIEKPFQIIEQP